jgi:hypothetical protein
MKNVVIPIIMLMFGLSAWSQTDRLDSLLNDVVWADKEMTRLLDTPSSFCYLYGSVAGENKTMYAGRELEDKMIAMNGNLYFFHSKGFFVGATGAWYDDPGAGYSNTIASAGINKSLNRKKSLSFRASYSRYFYANTDSASENPFTNNLGTGISFRNKWIGGRLSLYLLFGQDVGMNFTPAIFSRLPLVRFGKYNKIQLEPELSAFIGSETVELEKVSNLGGQQGSQITTITEDAYGLLNTQFYLPVCFYIGDFDLELGYTINIPTTQNESIDYPISSFFSFSVGYLLPIN